MNKLFFSAFFSAFSLLLTAQEHSTIHPVSLKYEYPTDKLVAEKLEQWRDLKFGILIHWGINVVPGIVESWSICNEDWINRDTNSNYCDYKEWYFGLSEVFNPTQFDPDQWADACANAGMKYLVFTTKHHDGFAMYDTHETDFKITNGPFKTHAKANIANYVFDAFRRRQFMIGAYFSKPDWHCPYYWWPRYATPDRNVNYDIRRFPDRWNRYKKFTHNQLNEITSQLGGVDILWLDGGWVRPANTITSEVLSWGMPIPPFAQDIDMEKVAEMVRGNQPGILIVDRTVHGKFENYKTPEQSIPAEQSDEPWESCITLAGDWGYVQNQALKSTEKIVHTLIEVVAKGGNLLLGLGPTKEGVFDQARVDRLKEIGQWLDVYGEAIYNTRSVHAFKSGTVYFTTGKDRFSYALPLFSAEKPLESNISWQGHLPKKSTKVTLVGSSDALEWQTSGETITVQIPERLRRKLAEAPAIALKFEEK